MLLDNLCELAKVNSGPNRGSTQAGLLAESAKQTAETDLAAQVDIVTERDNTIAALNTQIANLKKNPGAITKGIVTETDNNGVDKFDNEEFEVFASAKSLHDLLP